MAEGEQVKTRNEANLNIQERGEIYFFYRPKVNREEAHGEDDVQRLYIVLRPRSGDRHVEQKQSSTSPPHGKESAPSEGSGKAERGGGSGVEEVNIEEETLMRLIVLGRKKLPETDSGSKGRPHWGFVELVTTHVDQIKSALQGEEYETATRGHRHKPAARAMGEGIC